MGLVLGVATAISFLLLPLSIYPGLLSELAFLAAIGSPFWMPALCVTLWVRMDIAHEVRDLFGVPPGRRRWHAGAVSLLLLNAGLLWYDVPCKLAFLHARPAFEASVAAAPKLYSGSKTIGRRFGAYHVERLAADPRGGVFFQTSSGPDGFYTNRMKYGFSLRPNQAGCPFGDEKYFLSHVVGDWYVFQAADH
jgi:hypothetical protein